MFFKTQYIQLVIMVLHASIIAGCNIVQSERVIPSLPAIDESAPIPSNSLMVPTDSSDQPPPIPNLTEYEFPDSIDPVKPYMFYLHGRIIEDQGIPAISPEYGEYEFEAILKRLGEFGFVVISEQRPKNTDTVSYARKVTEQARALLNAGVPAKNITIVGASKGAGIAIHVSHFLENKEINFVIMAICHPATIADLKQNQTSLYGNVLSIYDSTDELAGSCQELFSFSEGKGISRYNEITLTIGTGHGILYQPLDEWVAPVIQWAGK